MLSGNLGNKVPSSIKVIIQSRTGSSRLPGKSLLPVCGFPAAVLCAKRAANTGLDVCVATSVETSDDLLVQTLEEEGISVFRGSLEDVFDRFIQATDGAPDDSVLVRLTADNLFPDGEFIQCLVDQLTVQNLQYITTSSPQDGLPYGMSAEAFTLKALRSCNTDELNEFDREHVTPAIRRKYGVAIMYQPETTARGHLRCTMDSFNDYILVNEIFSLVDAPVTISWLKLCSTLSKYKPKGFRIPWIQKEGRPLMGRLVLGTAQLGIQGYGIVNETKGVGGDEVDSIIQTAIEHGVTTLDCARAYGLAEQRVGLSIRKLQRPDIQLITKLDPLVDLPKDSSVFSVRSAVDASIYRSCRELGLGTLPVVMLHRWSHHNDYDGMIWARLKELKSEGVIRELGASVYAPEEAAEAIADSEVTHLQLPFNLLDKRWHMADIPELVRTRPELVVYARSAFLQGLLLHGPERWPNFPDLDRECLAEKLDELVVSLSRKSRTDLCIAYMLGQPWIDAAVLGVDSMGQLQDNLALVQADPLTDSECLAVRDALPEVSEVVLNPALWNTVERG